VVERRETGFSLNFTAKRQSADLAAAAKAATVAGAPKNDSAFGPPPPGYGGTPRQSGNQLSDDPLVKLGYDPQDVAIANARFTSGSSFEEITAKRIDWLEGRKQQGIVNQQNSTKALIFPVR